MIATENIGRCPKCHQFLVGEEIANHVCKIEPKAWVEEIFVDHINETVENADGDQVVVAKGLNGVYYRLITCNHSPSHSLKSRWLTGKDGSRQDNRASAPVLLSLRRTV